MTTESIEIRESWGAILVVAEDNGGTKVHHWFDTLGDEGEIVQFAEVIHYDRNNEHRRHYVSSESMMVPDKVLRLLHNEGFNVLNPVGEYDKRAS